MADKSSGDKLLYCSFLRQEPARGGASSSPARRCSSATSASSCATTSSARKAATAESARADKSKLPTPHEIRQILDQYVIGQDSQEDSLGCSLQPLQAAGARQQGRRGRAHQEQHPADRADRLRQDAARADARPPARRPVRDRRRDDADRGRLRRRGRREHHPEAAAEVRLRHREGAARHRLHRRDRQDLAQVRPTRRSPATSPARACSRRC